MLIHTVAILRNETLPWAIFLFFHLLPTCRYREEKWKATLAHRFVQLLHTNTGKLTRLYTQNIDGRMSEKKIMCDRYFHNSFVLKTQRLK
jgi:hypothetical protein